MQDRHVPLDVFVGRAAELARVAEVVTRVEAGQPWLVAVEGELGWERRPWHGGAWPGPSA